VSLEITFLENRSFLIHSIFTKQIEVFKSWWYIDFLIIEMLIALVVVAFVLYYFFMNLNLKIFLVMSNSEFGLKGGTRKIYLNLT